MTISQKIKRKINSIISWTGKIPEEIDVSREEYEELAREVQKQINIVEVLDKNKQPLNKFMGVKLKIKE